MTLPVIILITRFLYIVVDAKNHRWLNSQLHSFQDAARHALEQMEPGKLAALYGQELKAFHCEVLLGTGHPECISAFVPGSDRHMHAERILSRKQAYKN